MKCAFYAALFLALAAASGTALAQAPVLQTVSNAAGYQYRVPSDWVPGSVTDPTETFMGSSTQAEAAYVEVRSPDGDTPADMAQALLTRALTPSPSQSAYVVVNPSSPVQVTGADAAVGGAATFTDQNGTAGQEYIIAAVKGTTGYALIVDVPATVDAATPNLAQMILGSFQVGAVTAPPAPRPAATPIPNSSASVVAPSAGGASSAVPPPGCVSFTQGSCVTKCTDLLWSSGTGNNTCSGHGGVAASGGTTTASATAVPAAPLVTSVPQSPPLPSVANGSGALTQNMAYVDVPGLPGYSFQVPSDWQPAPDPSGDAEMLAPDGVESAIGVSASLGAAPSNALSAADTLLRAGLKGAVTGTSASSASTPSVVSVSIPGADAAESGAQTVVASGLTFDIYIISAVQGARGYAVAVILMSTYATANPTLAQAVLGSFSIANNSGATVIAPAISPVVPAASAAGDNGHTYYASSASNANTIYCDTDPDWQRLSPRNLVSYTSLAAAMTALPGYHLHQPC